MGKSFLVEIEEGFYVLKKGTNVFVLTKVEESVRRSRKTIPYSFSDLVVHPRTGELGVIRVIKGERRFIRVEPFNWKGTVKFEDRFLENAFKKLKYEKELRYFVWGVKWRKDKVLLIDGDMYRVLGTWNNVYRRIYLNRTLGADPTKAKRVLSHEVGHGLFDTLDLNLRRFEILQENLKKWMLSKGEISSKEIKQLEVVATSRYREMQNLFYKYLQGASRKFYNKNYTELSEKQIAALYEKIAWDIGKFLQGRKCALPLTPLFTRRALAWLRFTRSLLRKAYRIP